MSDPARNTYLRQLGAPDEGRYRQPLPGDVAMEVLLPLRTAIRTSYGTRGVVTALESWQVRGVSGERLTCWTIVIGRPDHRGSTREGWLNEYVVHGGRILHLFECNDDEVIIERVAPPVWADLPLFAALAA